MISIEMGLFFMALPVGCIYYIFRGLEENSNPLWGNVIAAGVSMVVSALLVIWFLQGSIVSPVPVTNATYTIPVNLSSSDLAGQITAASITTNKLAGSGAGMMTRSSISASGSSITNQTVITVHTSDIVYVQFQDYGVMFGYALAFLISFLAFIWSLSRLKDATEINEAEEDNPENYGGDGT